MLFIRVLNVSCSDFAPLGSILLILLCLKFSLLVSLINMFLVLGPQSSSIVLLDCAAEIMLVRSQLS